MKDIAERAGVSRATVSRALSNPNLVSPVKRSLVEQAVKDLTYRPNPLARGLATGSFPAICALISDVCNPFYAELVRGVEDTARGSGYAVMFGNTDDSPQREIDYLAHAAENHFAGTILMSAVGKVELKMAIHNMGRPLVLVSRRVPGLEADTVVVNNEQGGYMATRYLIEMGHRKICHLAGLKISSASVERQHGFIRAMKEAKLEIPEWAMVAGDLRLESGEDVGKQMVKDGLPCTAVFAANDQMAIGLISAFESQGVKVPADISVIGFDDIIYSKLARVQLTTLRQPTYEMGRAAMKMLLERLGGNSSTVRTLIFEPELIERETCAAPKK